MVLLRFAPSPTGALHLGGLRTALFNHLFARKLGGKWILRIEDTDALRYVPGSVDGIRNALDWAGLDYDYGPGRDGPHGPYYQSQRLDLYHSWAKKLLSSGHAYRCFCSPDQLAATRERLARTGSNSTYDKACLRLSEEEVGRRVRAGEKSIIRLNNTSFSQRSESVHDLVFGELKDAHASLATDPILVKTDGFPTYHLASVVDDTEMGITHVLRGEEWLPSLPLHLDLYSAFSLKPPAFAHLPLLLHADGSKMSKRKGGATVEHFVQGGWEPAAVLNWVALAGWGITHQGSSSSRSSSQSPISSSSSSADHDSHHHAPDSTAVLTMEDLINQFDISVLTHRRNTLDPAKLAFLNKHHLMQIPGGAAALAERVQKQVQSAYPGSKYTTIEYITQVIEVLQHGRLSNLTEVASQVPYVFTAPDLGADEAQSMILGISPEAYEKSLSIIRDRLASLSPSEWHDPSTDFMALLREECNKYSLKSKTVMTTVRHALSGMKSGPSIPEIIHLLGRERTLSRLCPSEGSPL